MLQPDHQFLCTIAGSDPTGGAGLQADLKTFSAHGAVGTAVITAVTVQDREGVHAVTPLDPDAVGAQVLVEEHADLPVLFGVTASTSPGSLADS